MLKNQIPIRERKGQRDREIESRTRRRKKRQKMQVMISFLTVKMKSGCSQISDKYTSMSTNISSATYFSQNLTIPISAQLDTNGYGYRGHLRGEKDRNFGFFSTSRNHLSPQSYPDPS